MDMIQEFVVSNLVTIGWSGGLLLLSQAISTMAHRQCRSRPASSHGDPMRGTQDDLKVKMIFLQLCLCCACCIPYFMQSMHLTLPTPLQTAPGCLALPACHQEGAPPHFHIYHKSIFIDFSAIFSAICHKLLSNFIFLQSSVWWILFGISSPACR